MKAPFYIAGISAFIILLSGCGGGGGGSGGGDSSLPTTESPTASVSVSECETEGCTITENLETDEIVVGDSSVNLSRTGSITLTTGD